MTSLNDNYEAQNRLEKIYYVNFGLKLDILQPDCICDKRV